MKNLVNRYLAILIALVLNVLFASVSDARPSGPEEGAAAATRPAAVAAKAAEPAKVKKKSGTTLYRALPASSTCSKRQEHAQKVSYLKKWQVRDLYRNRWGKRADTPQEAAEQLNAACLSGVIDDMLGPDNGCRDSPLTADDVYSVVVGAEETIFCMAGKKGGSGSIVNDGPFRTVSAIAAYATNNWGDKPVGLLKPCANPFLANIALPERGEKGERGLDGVNCWDLNHDGECNRNEDRNGDKRCNSLDCRGSKGDKGDKGDPGKDGLHCWDLDKDGKRDKDEDTNKDGVWDAKDCKGGTSSWVWGTLGGTVAGGLVAYAVTRGDDDSEPAEEEPPPADPDCPDGDCGTRSTTSSVTVASTTTSTKASGANAARSRAFSNAAITRYLQLQQARELGGNFFSTSQGQPLLARSVGGWDAGVHLGFQKGLGARPGVSLSNSRGLGNNGTLSIELGASYDEFFKVRPAVNGHINW